MGKILRGKAVASELVWTTYVMERKILLNELYIHVGKIDFSMK